jgi:AcrR family transcriptional regulator
VNVEVSAEPRPRNANATRQAILEAARRQFIRDGYDNAGLRAIAADAGIDPALICRYFGSKKQLFCEALESLSKDPMAVIRGERASCGQRLARAVLESGLERERHMGWIGLVLGATSSPEASALAHAQIEREFIEPFSEWIGGGRAREKAWLVSSLLLGAVIMNNIQHTCSAAEGNLADQIQRMLDD